jgi:uncharacterized membrane protein
VEFKVRVEIAQQPAVIWSVLMDLEHWPEWTPSITSIERLDTGKFGLGSEVRIQQPKLKTLNWRVSEFVEGRVFAWEAQTPGLFIRAGHEVQLNDRGSIVILTVHQSGWLAPLVNIFLGRLTRKYMQMEAQGLKRRVELPVST